MAMQLRCLICGRVPGGLRDPYYPTKVDTTGKTDLVIMQEHLVLDHPELGFSLEDHRQTEREIVGPGHYRWSIRGTTWLEGIEVENL